MNTSKRILAAAMAVAMTTALTMTAWAATEHWNDASAGKTAAVSSKNVSWETWKAGWDKVKTNYEQVALTPGATSSMMNFGWYSKTSYEAKVRLDTSKSMTNAKVFTGSFTTGSTVDGVAHYSNKVTVTGLVANTDYYYQYLLNGKWQDVSSFSTKSRDNFSVLFVGDPQIGSSKGQTPAEGTEPQSVEMAARNDSYNWGRTLDVALKAHPNISFMLSAGDQVNETVKEGSAAQILEQEYEYAGFLSPKAMRSLPVSTTIGNHDALTPGYSNHFNNPNPFTQEVGATAAGNGYYYTYGNALFVVLNTNNYNCASHKALIDKAVKSAPNAKWRVVMFHQDIYGSGLDHSDSDGIILRTQLTPIFDEYDIDVVLQGHDHTYSRTYQLSGDRKAHSTYGKDVDLEDAKIKDAFLADNLCYQITDTTQGTVTNPKGTAYVTANSATGSKFYELIPTQQNYIAARSQTWTPTYSVIDFTSDRFTITTYDLQGKKIDQPYTIVKTK